MAHAILTPEVSDILQRSTIAGTALRLPPGQLDRKLYDAVNKAIVNAGGKWNRSAQAHVFASDPREKLGLILESGVSRDTKKDFQAFFTPGPLADEMADWAEVRGHAVLEPSAGHGALADACMAHGATSVRCFELNMDSAGVLVGKGYETTRADFLEALVRPPFFTRVVMNPPFTKNQDIAHVRKALEWLTPGGGVLVAIMAPNTDRKGFQAITSSHECEIREIPAGAFKESGTPIRTIALKIRK